MKCVNCGKEVNEHERFYIFQYDNYYPAGGIGDLQIISSNISERKNSHYDYDDVLYVCGNKIRDIEDGEEILPWTAK